MNNYILFILSLLSIPCISQHETKDLKSSEIKININKGSSPKSNDGNEEKQNSRIYARYSIDNLKTGVLIVRLKSKQNAINALLKTGRTKKARELKEEIDHYNKKVIKSFKNHYTFSKVYFFYSKHTQSVKEKKFDSIFLNEKLEEDSSITLNPESDFYMIGDFDNVRTLTDEGEYSNQSSLISEAFVIKDSDFDQMPRPFPLFVRTGNKGLITYQIIKLNEKFHNFYIKK